MKISFLRRNEDGQEAESEGWRTLEVLEAFTLVNLEALRRARASLNTVTEIKQLNVLLALN